MTRALALFAVLTAAACHGENACARAADKLANASVESDTIKVEGRARMIETCSAELAAHPESAKVITCIADSNGSAGAIDTCRSLVRAEQGVARR